MQLYHRFVRFIIVLYLENCLSFVMSKRLEKIEGLGDYIPIFAYINRDPELVSSDW